MNEMEILNYQALTTKNKLYYVKTILSHTYFKFY